MSCQTYSKPSVFNNDPDLKAEGMELFMRLYPHKVRLVDRSKEVGENAGKAQTLINFETDDEFHDYVVDREGMIGVFGEDMVEYDGPYNKQLGSFYARILDPRSYFKFSGDFELMYGGTNDESNDEEDDNSTVSSKKRSKAAMDDNSSENSSIDYDVSIVRRSKRNA